MAYVMTVDVNIKFLQRREKLQKHQQYTQAYYGAYKANISKFGKGWFVKKVFAW